MVATPTEQELTVPLYRQQHALSCEAAALRMAMAALGRTVSESELLSRLARDPTPRTRLPDGRVQWGDPDRGFVGAWDGVFARDGYGVYDGPIADLARFYGFNSTVHGHGLDPQQLYEAIHEGFPVVVWMPYGRAVRGRGSWITPDRKRVDYVVTEHAVVLAGVRGDGVSYADPYTGTLESATFDEFEAALSELDNRAVILKP